MAKKSVANLVELASERVARLATSGIDKLGDYAPENELNRRTFNQLNEAQLWALVSKYGRDKVENWLMKEQGQREV